jgi:hypothetical protein
MRVIAAAFLLAPAIHISALPASARQLVSPPVAVSWPAVHAPEWSALAAGAGDPSLEPRMQAIEHSDAYYTRLTIHRIGSYAILPLFAGEYLLGQKLINGGDVAGWVKPTHGVVAGTIGALFAVNTVTGVWNLIESRNEPEGRARRLVHSVLMLTADAGFAYTGSLGGEAGDDDFGEERGNAGRHRDFAIGSMAVASAATLIMWLWR